MFKIRFLAFLLLILVFLCNINCAANYDAEFLINDLEKD